MRPTRRANTYLAAVCSTLDVCKVTNFGTTLFAASNSRFKQSMAATQNCFLTRRQTDAEDVLVFSEGGNRGGGGGAREASEKDSEKRGIWDVKLKSSEAENSRSKFAGSRTVDCLAGAPSQPASEPVSQSFLLLRSKTRSQWIIFGLLLTKFLK